MNQSRKKFWLDKDAWPSEHVVWLLLGSDPGIANNAPEGGESGARDALREATLCGKIEAIEIPGKDPGRTLYYGNHLYYPYDIIMWASKKKRLFPKFPFTVKDLENLDVSDSHVGKPFGTKERETLLCVIAALCDTAKIDIKSKSAVTNIAHATQKIGAEVSEGTIRGILKKISDALESRAK
jgi:hypothetical protein